MPPRILNGQKEEPITLTGPTGRFTAEGRPTFFNSVGSESSEISITFQSAKDGKWYNYPSIHNGVKLEDQGEIENIFYINGGVDPETGNKSKPFESVKEAEKAAVARSKNIK